MDKEYLSIKEFAAAVGVSQQYVYNQLNKKLKNYCIVVENKKMLKKSALELFEKKEKESEIQQVEQQLNNKLIEALEKRIEEQMQQLQEKDKQIANLQQSLDQSQQLLDQAQKLHAIEVQRVKELEDKAAAVPEEPEKKKWWFWRKN